MRASLFFHFSVTFLCISRLFSDSLFEQQFRLKYSCTAERQRWRSLYYFIQGFSQQEYIYASDIPHIYAVVVLLTNFINRPFSKPIFLKFKRLIREALCYSKPIHSSLRKISFKTYLRHIKKDISKLEIIIYSFLHRKSIEQVCMNQRLHRSNSISFIARNFQPYKRTIYKFNNEYIKDTTANSFLSLPDFLIIRILRKLENHNLFSCLFTCRQLFYLGSKYCELNMEHPIFDVLLQSSNGVCLQYKLYNSIFRLKQSSKTVDCICPLCFTTCSCDLSKNQHASQIKKLLFRNCKFGKVVLRTLADVDYAINTLRFIPQKLVLSFPVGIYRLTQVLSSFPYLNSFEYILDVNMFRSEDTLFNMSPVIQDICIHFVASMSFYRKDGINILRKLIRGHLDSVKVGTKKLRALTLHHCPVVNEVFSLPSSPHIWYQHIKVIKLYKSSIQCSFFGVLKELTALTLLYIEQPAISSSCDVTHFRPYFRTDFINFELVRNRIVQMRSELLRIKCDISECFCGCQDIVFMTSLIKEKMLSGLYTFQECTYCRKIE